jgi:hypothetical protein
MYVVGMEVLLHAFSHSIKWSRVVSFTLQGKLAPGTHWIGGWEDPEAGLESVMKTKFLFLQGIELRFSGRTA